MLLKLLSRLGCIDDVIYACNDSLGVRSGIEHVRQAGLRVAGVSGWVACSPLSAREAQAWADVPVLQMEALQDPAIVAFFDGGEAPALPPQRWPSSRWPVEMELRVEAGA
jgi:hypothetical protein